MSAFVDSSDPLATDVSMDVSMLGDPAVTVDFDDVPVGKMTQIEEK